MADPLPDECAVHIGSAERKCHLRQLCADIDKISFNVREVIEHQPADRDRFHIRLSRRAALDARFTLPAEPQAG